jgi:uncharacterized membrane protein
VTKSAAAVQVKAKPLHWNKMERYHKIISFFSYLFGFISLIAVLVNDKKDKVYSFYIWQALLLNLFLGIISALFYGFFIPYYMLSLDAGLRTAFFLTTTLIPVSIIIILLLILGIMSYKEIKFNVPLIGNLAKKITKYEVM